MCVGGGTPRWKIPFGAALAPTQNDPSGTLKVIWTTKQGLPPRQAHCHAPRINISVLPHHQGHLRTTAKTGICHLAGSTWFLSSTWPWQWNMAKNKSTARIEFSRQHTRKVTRKSPEEKSGHGHMPGPHPASWVGLPREPLRGPWQDSPALFCASAV